MSSLLERFLPFHLIKPFLESCAIPRIDISLYEDKSNKVCVRLEETKSWHKVVNMNFFIQH